MSSRFNASRSWKGILQFLHSIPGVTFSLRQCLHTFFYLKYLFWLGLYAGVGLRFITSIRRCLDSFFFSFSSLSGSSSRPSLLNRTVVGGLAKGYSVNSFSSCFLRFVLFLMCSTICDRICSFSFSQVCLSSARHLHNSSTN